MKPQRFSDIPPPSYASFIKFDIKSGNEHHVIGYKVKFLDSCCIITWVDVQQFLAYMGWSEDWGWIREEMLRLNIESEFSAGRRWLRVSVMTSIVYSIINGMAEDENNSVYISRFRYFMDEAQRLERDLVQGVLSVALIPTGVPLDVVEQLRADMPLGLHITPRG